mmetsp:Transcript_2577/g.7619  ORF Transcript_2577/g.7619 Transcript_2577/m.7619 type:complete len:317 (+) Transcript_2577:261-1211(+)
MTGTMPCQYRSGRKVSDLVAHGLEPNNVLKKPPPQDRYCPPEPMLSTCSQEPAPLASPGVNIHRSLSGVTASQPPCRNSRCVPDSAITAVAANARRPTDRVVFTDVHVYMGVVARANACVCVRLTVELPSVDPSVTASAVWELLAAASASVHVDAAAAPHSRCTGVSITPCPTVGDDANDTVACPTRWPRSSSSASSSSGPVSDPASRRDTAPDAGSATVNQDEAGSPRQLPAYVAACPPDESSRLSSHVSSSNACALCPPTTTSAYRDNPDPPPTDPSTAAAAPARPLGPDPCTSTRSHRRRVGSAGKNGCRVAS